MASLRDLPDRLNELDDDSTIYAAPPWTSASAAVAVVEDSPEMHAALAAGMTYLLEVDLVYDVLEAWHEWRPGRTATSDDKCAAVIHYAEHDAYLEG
ncbi:hypothetical protein [Lentzea nigeriaca]|uniref:hypothetical protein n=1 Tax=Lentzea nigeriaca TaxID=1128665 RepID=UPI0019574AE7|nr:hypothetical protein [Lentzea nigeriaca]MBM7858707.1 hypothetical protein [Lentzea nigeriaca]